MASTFVQGAIRRCVLATLVAIIDGVASLLGVCYLELRIGATYLHKTLLYLPRGKSLEYVFRRRVTGIC